VDSDACLRRLSNQPERAVGGMMEGERMEGKVGRRPAKDATGVVSQGTDERL